MKHLLANAITAQAKSGMSFEPGKFIETLPYLLEGMLGIAIVMGLIIGMIYLLNKLFKKD